MSRLPPPALRHVTDLTVTLDSIRHMNHGRAGLRRIIPIVGGTAKGPAINGKILNVGADWQTQFASGLTELDTRYAIETDDGATIETEPAEAHRRAGARYRENGRGRPLLHGHIAPDASG